MTLLFFQIYLKMSNSEFPFEYCRSDQRRGKMKPNSKQDKNEMKWQFQNT